MVVENGDKDVEHIPTSGLNNSRWEDVDLNDTDRDRLGQL